jgi:hypothetical protein
MRALDHSVPNRCVSLPIAFAAQDRAGSFVIRTLRIELESEGFEETGVRIALTRESRSLSLANSKLRRYPRLLITGKPRGRLTVAHSLLDDAFVIAVHYAEFKPMPSTPAPLKEESSRQAMERAVQLRLFYEALGESA